MNSLFNREIVILQVATQTTACGHGTASDWREAGRGDLDTAGVVPAVHLAGPTRTRTGMHAATPAPPQAGGT